MTGQVYLAGPKSTGENPYLWHEAIAEECPEIEWINPFTAQATDATRREIFDRDLELACSSDAVLLRRKPDYNLCGASMEAYAAFRAGVPVVVWNQAGDELPLFLDMVSVESWQTLPGAVGAVEEVIFNGE